MSERMIPIVLAAAALSLLAGLALWPQIDLIVSGLVASSDGFILRHNIFLIALTKAVFYGARALFVFLIGAAIFLKAQRKACLYLLLCLLLGPGLIANVVLKDHWGRARPREIAEFGGKAAFTPALIISQECKRNCSFVSGDGAFGFFLPCFAYVVPRRRSRRVFWSCMGVGVIFGTARILIGAHFLSDVLYAAALVLALGATLHAVLFGRRETASLWREWLGLTPLQPDAS